MTIRDEAETGTNSPAYRCCCSCMRGFFAAGASEGASRSWADMLRTLGGQASLRSLCLNFELIEELDSAHLGGAKWSMCCERAKRYASVVWVSSPRSLPDLTFYRVGHTLTLSACVACIGP